MHRSGTSAVARGLAALSVYLGNDFLDAQPENPTGYWEDRGIVALNEHLLKQFDLRWDDTGRIQTSALLSLRLWPLRRHAARYIRKTFGAHALWAFKDPRTIRVLPFWRHVLEKCRTDDSYVVVIRHPLSIAASLLVRQQMDREHAYRLWLDYMVPFLRQLVGRPWVVVDYDRLMQEPRAQLERVAMALTLPTSTTGEIDRFAGEFLDQKLRHTIFSPENLDVGTATSRVTRDAYSLLYGLASDRPSTNGSEFWKAWERVENDYARLPLAMSS